MARIKTSGAELKKFWADTNPEFWPDEAYVDDMSWQVNGVAVEDVDVDVLADTDEVLLEGFIVYADCEKEVASVMRKWRKIQSHVTFAVEVPAAAEAALIAFLKAHDGKILGR